VKENQDRKITTIWPRCSINYNETRIQNSPIYSFIPLYEQDETSVLAYAFNLPVYY